MAGPETANFVELIFVTGPLLNFTEFIFAKDRFERLQREIIKKIIHIIGTSLFIQTKVHYVRLLSQLVYLKACLYNYVTKPGLFYFLVLIVELLRCNSKTHKIIGRKIEFRETNFEFTNKVILKQEKIMA